MWGIGRQGGGGGECGGSGVRAGCSGWLLRPCASLDKYSTRIHFRRHRHRQRRTQPCQLATFADALLLHSSARRQRGNCSLLQHATWIHALDAARWWSGDNAAMRRKTHFKCSSCQCYLAGGVTTFPKCWSFDDCPLLSACPPDSSQQAFQGSALGASSVALSMALGQQQQQQQQRSCERFNAPTPPTATSSNCPTPGAAAAASPAQLVCIQLSHSPLRATRFHEIIFHHLVTSLWQRREQGTVAAAAGNTHWQCGNVETTASSLALSAVSRL